MSEDLVNVASRYLARHTSRRSFLIKAVTVGSALVAGPVQYLLRPGSALATDVGNCPGKKCADGYTEFCCTVNTNPGLSRNTCPSYSYVGGWWKACTSGNYNGPYMCHGSSRYFMDCNLIPGDYCVSHCSHNDCNDRAVCHNLFTYGNCHAGKYGITPVVCRLISCQPPYNYTGGCFQCNSTYKEDPNTCNHESSCYCGQCADPNSTYIGSCGDGCC